MSAPTAVYLYYDRAARLIYVGITSKGPARQGQHSALAEWWPYVHSQTVEHHPDRVVAAARERQLIQAYRPPFNQQHNSGWERVKAAYMQVVDAEAILAAVQAGENFVELNSTVSPCGGHCPECTEGNPGACHLLPGEFGPFTRACPHCGSERCIFLIGYDEGDRERWEWESGRRNATLDTLDRLTRSSNPLATPARQAIEHLCAVTAGLFDAGVEGTGALAMQMEEQMLPPRFWNADGRAKVPVLMARNRTPAGTP